MVDSRLDRESFQHPEGIRIDCEPNFSCHVGIVLRFVTKRLIQNIGEGLLGRGVRSTRIVHVCMPGVGESHTFYTRVFSALYRTACPLVLFHIRALF